MVDMSYLSQRNTDLCRKSRRSRAAMRSKFYRSLGRFIARRILRYVVHRCVSMNSWEYIVCEGGRRGNERISTYIIWVSWACDTQSRSRPNVVLFPDRSHNVRWDASSGGRGGDKFTSDIHFAWLVSNISRYERWRSFFGTLLYIKLAINLYV